MQKSSPHFWHLKYNIVDKKLLTSILQEAWGPEFWLAIKNTKKLAIVAKQL